MDVLSDEDAGDKSSEGEQMEEGGVSEGGKINQEKGPKIGVTTIPMDPGMRGPEHERNIVKLIRSIRKRIRHLQALPPVASRVGELEELMLALDTVGGTEVVWDQDFVNHVVAQNVKTALNHATPTVKTDPASFKLLAPKE